MLSYFNDRSKNERVVNRISDLNLACAGWLFCESFQRTRLYF